MITICSFFSLPIVEQRIGKVYSLANSAPRGFRVDGQIRCLVPPWNLVNAYREHRINEDDYTAEYRKHVVRHWPEIRRWLDSLDVTDEMYPPCCRERTGFCHRYLVAKLLRKFRPDLDLKVS